MRIRLGGTQAEIAPAVEALRAGFEVQDVSRFYPNRGSSVLGYVYVTAVPLPSSPVRARATRTDRATRSTQINRTSRGELER